jgi:thiol-disulfide isomerase/thioredoxin
MRQHEWVSARPSNRRRISLAAIAILLPATAGHAAETVPPCQLTLNATGQTANFDSFRGQVLYIDFWASWCGPCQLSFPFMNDVQRDYGKRGLHVIAIDMDEKAADAAGFLDRHPAGFDIAKGPNAQCAKDFGVAAMPTSYLVDRNGAVRLVHKGFRPGDTAELRAKLDALMAEGGSAQ